jgi:hypothetical protein
MTWSQMVVEGQRHIHYCDARRKTASAEAVEEALGFLGHVERLVASRVEVRTASHQMQRRVLP